MSYDVTYCAEHCEIGIVAKKLFLNKNDSVFGAASAFWQFVDNCTNVCPYKAERAQSVGDKHENN